MNLREYISWHYKTRLKAIQGLFQKNEDVLREQEKIEAALKDLDKTVEEWANKSDKK